MTAILDRVPVDRITAEAKNVRFGRTVLSVLAGLLYGIGWLAAKGAGLIWLGLAWAGTAVTVGWLDARKSADRGTA